MTDTSDADLGRDLADHLRSRADAAEPSADPGPRIMAQARRQRARRRRSVTVLISAVVLVLAVVGGVVFTATRSTSSDVVTVGEAVVGTTPARLYRASGSLLESPTEPLRLCLAGGVETKDLRPSDTAGVPRCGTNVPLHGVDLATVAGITTKTWQDQTFSTSSVVVIGTWDGVALTATAPVVPGADPIPPSPTPDTTIPCTEPSTGWPAMPPDVNAYTTAIGQLDAYGQAHPDFAGSWVAGPDQSVMVEAFTGDLATHQAELSAIYPRVCVVPGTRTMASLRQIQQDLFDDGLPSGNRIFGSGIGLDEDRAAGPFVVSISMLIDDPDVRAWLHDRFGDAVRIDSAPLRPA